MARGPFSNEEMEKMRPAMEALGSKIAQWRCNRGRSQWWLQSAVGMDHSHLSRIENGKVLPSLYILSRISKATGMRFDIEIVDGEVIVK